jgi:hypothetical protein
MKVTKRHEFLRATDSGDWRTLEEIVETLDRADYWRNQQHPKMDKREHVRLMIATLFFRKDAPRPKDDPSDRTLVGLHMFVSTVRANKKGALRRVYKPLINLTFAEVKEIAEQHEALDAYYEHRSSTARDALSAADFLIEELTEETMRRALLVLLSSIGSSHYVLHLLVYQFANSERI